MRTLAEPGCAVVFYSSELMVYEHTCDRVIVLRRGSVSAELSGEEIQEHNLLHAVNVGGAERSSRAG